MNQHTQTLLWCIATALFVSLLWLLPYLRLQKRRWKKDLLKNRKEKLAQLRRLEPQVEGDLGHIREEADEGTYLLRDLDPHLTFKELDELEEKYKIQNRDKRIEHIIQNLEDGTSDFEDKSSRLKEMLILHNLGLEDFDLDESCWERFAKAHHRVIAIDHRAFLWGGFLRGGGWRKVCQAAENLKWMLDKGLVTSEELELKEDDLAFIERNG